MKLNQQQIAFLTRFVKGDDFRPWLEILGCAIIHIKDECVLADLSKEGAKAAIGELETLVNQLTLLKDGKNPEEKVAFN